MEYLWINSQIPSSDEHLRNLQFVSFYSKVQKNFILHHLRQKASGIDNYGRFEESNSIFCYSLLIKLNLCLRKFANSQKVTEGTALINWDDLNILKMSLISILVFSSKVTPFSARRSIRTG